MPQTGFIGPFSPPFVGDGIKNDFLKEGFLASGVKQMAFFDSIRRDRSRWAYFSQLIRFVWRYPQLVLSLNKNGRLFVVTLIYFIGFLRKKRAVLYVIGGSFDRQIKMESWLYRKVYLHFLKQLDWIWAESHSLKEGLESLGLKNVEIIYNPRKDWGAKWQLDEAHYNRIVFVSRVTRTKGVADLMDAVNQINQSNVKKVALDIYGDIDPDFESALNEFVSASSGSITYKGVLNPSEVQGVVASYHLLALPTFHFGEGLPGILVEAGMAGTPILITRYNALGEYFKQGESAIFVEPHDVDGIKAQLVSMLSDDELCQELSLGIQKVVEPFKVESVMADTVKMCHQKGWSFV